MNTIKITMVGTGDVLFEDVELRNYTWSVGMAGELIIYYAIMHTVISNAETESGIEKVYAAGTWHSVENVPQ